MVGILIESGMHLHDRIISQRRDAWVHTINLTNSATFFLLKSLYQVGKVTGVYLCAMSSGIDFAYFYDISIGFRTASTVWYFFFHFI